MLKFGPFVALARRCTLVGRALRADDLEACGSPGAALREALAAPCCTFSGWEAISSEIPCEPHATAPAAATTSAGSDAQDGVGP